MQDRRLDDEAFNLVELARRLANVVREGTVAAVDPANYRVRVQYDTDEAGEPVLTAPIPWMVTRAGPDREWWAPEVGEQVVLLAPSGELTQALALPALYSDAMPAPSDDPDKRVQRYSDGAVFEYDRDAHRYKVTLPAAGEMVVSIGGSTWKLESDGMTLVTPSGTQTWGTG